MPATDSNGETYLLNTLHCICKLHCSACLPQIASACCSSRRVPGKVFRRRDIAPGLTACSTSLCDQSVRAGVGHDNAAYAEAAPRLCIATSTFCNVFCISNEAPPNQPAQLHKANPVCAFSKALLPQTVRQVRRFKTCFKRLCHRSPIQAALQV